MKILLVNPQPSKGKSYTILPNIGLGYIAESLRKSNDVTILDCVLEGIDQNKFQKYVKSNDFDLIGFSVFTRTLNTTKNYIEIVKEIRGDAYIIVGGPHAIFEPVETLTLFNHANFVFYGESEEGFPMLINALENNYISEEILSNIPNLVWRNKSQEIMVNSRSYVDVNRVPIPDWELVHPERYPAAPNGIFSRAPKIAPIVITRGCPYPCTFCGAGIASGKKLRKRNIDNVIEEIKLLRDKHGIKEIHIMDDNFTLDMDYAKEICRAIIRENIRMNFACPNGIRLDRIDEELLKLMEKAGFYSFAVGIESGTQKTLDYMKKGIKIKEIIEKIDLIKSVSNIEITGFFMIGYPNETVEDVRKTISLAKELKIDKANFFNFTPFPGSAEYLKLKSEGKLDGIDYSKLYIHEIIYSNDKISKRKLKWLQIKAHLSFYIRFRILMKLFREIKTFTQLKIILNRIVDIIF